MAKQTNKNGYGYGYGYGGYGDNGMFSVQEAYKAIRTNIILSIIKDGCKKIVITSANPHEGKSTTSVNVAISLAQAFKRVLLVDCDLRKAKVHKALGIPGEPGLTNIISKMADVEDAVQPTKYANLFCLPAGLFAPNPAEMLASGRFSELITKLEEKFDYIIFDTPPINVVSDALPIIKLSDGVVLIVRSKVSVYSEFEQALSALEFIDARLLGVIVNGYDGSEENGSQRKYGRYGKYGNYGGYGGYGKSAKSDPPETT